VKWLNTLPFHGSIHGFESRTGHQLVLKQESKDERKNSKIFSAIYNWS